MEREELDKLVVDIYESTKSMADVSEGSKILDLEAIKSIVEPLIELVEKAKEGKMYLYLIPLKKWFFPNELENEIRKGCYIYTSNLWSLRNPIERLKEMEKEIVEKKEELRNFKNEVSRYLYGDKEKNLFMK